MIKKNILLLALFVSIQLGADPMMRGRGLIPPTQVELEHIKTHWDKVSKVHPNKIGAARIRIQSAKQGQIIHEGSLSVHLNDEFGELSGNSSAAFALPSYIDNSKLPSFPPIGDQGLLGSCLAWASTYYQGSHELGLVNGRNNKTTCIYRLSPKWTYNMINGGRDHGAMITDAYRLLSQNGATNWPALPYDEDYLMWDLNPQDWISALSNRLTPPKFLPGLDYDLTLIKQVLNNGHILTFATFIDSWVTTLVGSHPDADNRFAGQKAAFWMNGREGGHMMTIVGYNDDLWIDVNGNGEMDPGEKGAFLVANSWATTWGNEGLIWISYDAFLSASAVQNGPSNGRVPLADASGSCAILATAKAPHYVPALVAQFSLSQAQRNQIKIDAGVSDPSTTYPSFYFHSGAVAFQGGPFDFSGESTSVSQSATFCLDLTDLIPKGQRYYFSVTDNQSGYSTTLSSFALLDLVHGKVIRSTDLPRTVDNGRIVERIDYTYSLQDKNLVSFGPIGISWPIHNQIIHEEIPLIFTSPTPVNRVDFYIDSTLIATELEGPYCVFVDTAQLVNGTHRLSTIAYKDSETPIQSSVLVTVAN